eukprot:TRINITY_DN53687_c0_g1_i1.p1 TRINITY_DN53687_c0_g1~~TRINITY_DN53687_c0_g1_i1.p1  ORF type:complete len:408 (-),score=118.34 TRINITY_DN53687_c0_g1_i1:144-1367(-)
MRRQRALSVRLEGKRMEAGVEGIGIRRGYLLKLKRVGMIDKWKERWFSLEEDGLRYYVSDSMKKMKGVLSYKDIVGSGVCKENECMFYIETKLKGNKKYQFIAESEEVASSWVDSVQIRVAMSAGGSWDGDDVIHLRQSVLHWKDVCASLEERTHALEGMLLVAKKRDREWRKALFFEANALTKTFKALCAKVGTESSLPESSVVGFLNRASDTAPDPIPHIPFLVSLYAKGRPAKKDLDGSGAMKIEKDAEGALSCEDFISLIEDSLLLVHCGKAFLGGPCFDTVTADCREDFSVVSAFFSKEQLHLLWLLFLHLDQNKMGLLRRIELHSIFRALRNEIGRQLGKELPPYEPLEAYDEEHYFTLADFVRLCMGDPFVGCEMDDPQEMAKTLCQACVNIVQSLKPHI